MLHIFNILSISVIAAIVWSVIKVAYNIWFHPLRKYPGPKLWAASRLAWASSFQSGHFHHKLAELHAKFGPVVRVAPDELSYIDAGAWRDIYENRNIGKNRTWASGEEKTGYVSIVSTDEATHLRNKRALTGAFTEHAITEHAAILEGLIGLMAQKFEKAIAQNQGSATFNVVDWFNFLTFDISGALSFGESFGSVENGKAHPWVEISCSFGKGVALMATVNFFDPLNKLLKHAMPTKLMEKMKYHKELTHERMMQRLAMENKSKVQDYIGSIQTYNADKGEIKMSEKEMETNMTVLIFAGSETTSTATACILNELLRNPAALETATKEVRAAFQSEDGITVSNVHKMEYLNAVIQEGLRVGPPAPIGVPRLTPQEGATICGEHVPGGTFVYVSQYPAFRSPINFTQPEAFVPERFLPSSPFPADRLEAFEPFLLGRHKCIGQKLAQTIMRLTLAKLLFKFDISAVQDLKDFGEQNTYIFWDKKPLQVELKLRKV